MIFPIGNSIILNGTVMVSTARLPSSSSGDQFGSDDWVRYKLCMCADGMLFRVQVTGQKQAARPQDESPWREPVLEEPKRTSVDS